MSQTTATVRSGLRTGQLPASGRRPSLRVISAEPRAPKQLPFLLFCSGLLALGLLALLLLNTELAQGAYLMHKQQTTSTRLAEDEMMLREELGTVESAQSLAAAAYKLGMVPLGQPPLTLELSTGAVRGLTREQAPAGEDAFSVVTTPVYQAPASEKPSSKPTQKPSEQKKTDKPGTQQAAPGVKPKPKPKPATGQG